MNPRARLLILLFMALIAAPRLAAQDTVVTKSLLWEISGNGLEHASYLFGTMHRHDRRAFHFGDSVLIMLGRCTTFASELHLDSVIREFLEGYVLSADGYDRLAEITSGEEEEEADTARAGGDSPGHTAPEGPIDSAEAGTFVDPKRIFAEPGDTVSIESVPRREEPPSADTVHEAVLPDPDEHAGHGSKLRRNESPYQKRMRLERNREFLRSDGNQLIGGAEWVKKGDRPAVVDAFLFATAKKLGLRLLGLERLVEQLSLKDDFDRVDYFETPPKRTGRGRGKTRPTDPFAAQTEMVEMYSEGDIEGLHEMLVKMSSRRAYKHAITDRNLHMADRAEPLMREGPTFIAVGAGHLGGGDGLIALFRARGYTVRPVKPVFDVPLDSVGYPPTLDHWYRLSSVEGAFAVDLPVEPLRLNREQEGVGVDSDGDTYMWPDVSSGIVYYVSYSDFDNAGTVLDSAALFRRLARDEGAAGDEDAGAAMHPIAVAGLNGIESEVTRGDEKVARRRVLVRGTRSYVLETVSLERQAHGGDAEHFLESFQPLAPASTEWIPFTSEAGGFSIQLPAGPSESADTLRFGTCAQRTKYDAKDPNTGLHYRIECYRFPAYYQAPDTAALINRMLNDVTDSDTCPVAALHSLRQAGLPAFDVVTGDTASEYRRRMRVIIRGDRMYVMYGAFSRAEFAAPATERFFDSFAPVGANVPGDLFADKSDLLFRTIATGSPAERRRALTVLNDAPGIDDKLSQIYSLLEQRFPDDDRFTVWSSTRSSLLGLLETHHDSTTVAFLERLYPQISWYETLRDRLLAVLVGIGSDDALRAFMRLARPEVQIGEDVTDAFEALADQPANLRSIYPELLELMSNDQYRPAVSNVIAAAIDSGSLERTTLEPYRDRIVADCRAVLRRRVGSGDDEENAWEHRRRLTELARVLGYLGGAGGSYQLLTRILDMDHENTALRMTALAAIVRSGHAPPRSELRSLAGDLNYRIDLYQEFAGMGKLELFPRDYRTQQAVAEGLLAQWLLDSDEDSVPDDMMLLAERELTIDGRTGRAYLFAFRFGTGKWMVGLSGLQPLDREQADAFATHVASDFDGRDDMTIDEHFARLVKTAQENR